MAKSAQLAEHAVMLNVADVKPAESVSPMKMAEPSLFVLLTPFSDTHMPWKTRT
jgi:hypothetical protein